MAVATTHQSRGIGELLGSAGKSWARGAGHSHRVSRDQQQARERDPALRAARVPARDRAQPAGLRALRRLHGIADHGTRRLTRSCTRAGSRDSSSTARPATSQAAARFWSDALGLATEKPAGPGRRHLREAQGAGRAHAHRGADRRSRQPRAPRHRGRRHRGGGQAARVARRQADQQGPDLGRHGSADRPALLRRAAAEPRLRPRTRTAGSSRANRRSALACS